MKLYKNVAQFCLVIAAKVRRNRIARQKQIEISVVLEQQLAPLGFAHAVRHLRASIATFETTKPAVVTYAPSILLKAALLAY
jgi:hypothetical protein